MMENGEQTDWVPMQTGSRPAWVEMLFPQRTQCSCTVCVHNTAKLVPSSLFVQCCTYIHCINKLLETSSTVLCTHTVQLHCFPFGNSFSSQAGLSMRTWKRTVDPLPYSGVERALRPSVPSIPLRREFPCLVWHREGTLSRVWPRFQARAAWKLGTDWLAWLTCITI